MARQETQMQELAALVTQARKGSVEAYTEIVRRFQDMIVGYAYSILGDFHLAEDAAQETFVAAYLDLPSLQRVEAFVGWLRRITSRRCVNFGRGKHVPTVPIEQEAELVSANPGPEEVAEKQEVRHFVQAAIRGLPQREREVTTLLYINGYSQKEVGDFLEITTGAVRNRLHAARNKLRERMIGMVEQTLHEQRPSKDEGFLDRVTASLPTGTVTFLFTDIEGSTKLCGDYPKAMKKALAQHDALLREKIEEHSGYVFKTVGDAFCAAFDTARDALDAAIDAHRALAEAKWEKTGPLKVRMALHIGAAQERDGDYFGPPLNRVARLLSIGHGGQILVSLPFEELIRDDLPEGVGLKDLGEQRLKDLIRPEQVFQVTAPGPAEDFPALKSLDTFSHNLPIQLTSFIGREKEIAEAKRLLGSTRLLTATGPGGTGKTRLSLQVGADVVEEYPDGVWLVELDAISDEAYLPQAVATVLGVKQEAGQSLVDTLAKHLATKEMLLVMDNCEHVVKACAQLAESLLKSCPKVKILASSRETLGIGGETTLIVPPLSVPEELKTPSVETLTQFEAVRLFIDRAVSVQPSFAVTSKNAPGVAQICHQVDGMPLAIELAAARVRMMSVDQIARRLDDRLRLLTGGRRTAMPRQQTLLATIDWSYQLLSDDEKRALAILSVFEGSFCMEAAEAVLASVEKSLDAIELVDALLMKSLAMSIDDGEERRYGFLAVIREYGRQRLSEEGNESVAISALGDWVTSLIESYPTLSQAYLTSAEFDTLTREYPNIRRILRDRVVDHPSVAGVKLAVKLWGFWIGNYVEGLLWLQASTRVDGLPPREAGDAYQFTSLFLLTAGEVDSATEHLEKAKAFVEECGDPGLLIGYSAIEASSKFYLGQYEEGVEGYEHVVALAQEHERDESNWHMLLADAYSLTGRFESARRQQQIALDMAKKAGTRDLYVKVTGAWIELRAGCLIDGAQQLISVFKNSFQPILCSTFADATQVAACIAGKNRNHSDAVRWASTTSFHWKGRGVSFIEPIQDFISGIEREARTALGDTEVEAAIAQGQGLSIEEVAKEALAFLEEYVREHGQKSKE